MFGAVGARAAHDSILQDPGLMQAETLALFAFGANIEAELRLMMRPIYQPPVLSRRMVS